jgi:hypothetical protein
MSRLQAVGLEVELLQRDVERLDGDAEITGQDRRRVPAAAGPEWGTGLQHRP